jgi:adenylate cyclase
MSRVRLGRRFGVAQPACFVLLMALIALRIWDPPPVEELRLRTFDFYQMLRPRTAQQRPVVIVDIDEASLKELGQWPWPRTLLAEIVDRVTQRGAVAIGFDIVFPEPDRMSPADAADLFRNLDEETRKKLRLLPSNDELLALALRRSRVVLGQAGAATRADESQAEYAAQAGFVWRGPNPVPYLMAFPGLLQNVPLLEAAAAGRGLLTIMPERDGVVRRVPLVMAAGGDLVPALTLEVLRVATGSSAILIRSDEAGVSSVALPGLDMPTDQNARLWIQFAPHDRARFVSAIDLLRDRTPPDRFDGRFVLVGTSAVGLLDLKTTPIDPAMPGVEVNAQVLENVLTKATLWRPNFSIGAELAAAGVLGLGTIIATPIMGAGAAFILGAATIALVTGASWYLYLHDNLLFDYTFPLLATTLLYFALVFVNYFREEERRKKMRSAFSFYLSPALVDELANNPEKLVLGGEVRNMTILFSDVRGFTTMSEHYKNDPQRLTSLMNRYLTSMTNGIISHRGTIDKYVGDAIKAFWNAPLDDAEHELNACSAALEMLGQLDLLNHELKREADEAGEPHMPFRIGVGINTGQCVVGNMGSDLRFNYSVLGDSVNLASRLEGRTKNYGVPIILGSSTAAAARRRFAAIEIDLIQVKGKTEPQAVFTLLGGEDVLNSVRFKELDELNRYMLEQYRRQDWSAAARNLALCRKVADGFGLDRLYEIYSQRIEHFRSDPPLPDWSGVFVYDTK